MDRQDHSPRREKAAHTFLQADGEARSEKKRRSGGQLPNSDDVSSSLSFRRLPLTFCCRCSIADMPSVCVCMCVCGSNQVRKDGYRCIQYRYTRVGRACVSAHQRKDEEMQSAAATHVEDIVAGSLPGVDCRIRPEEVQQCQALRMLAGAGTVKCPSGWVRRIGVSCRTLRWHTVLRVYIVMLTYPPCCWGGPAYCSWIAIVDGPFSEKEGQNFCCVGKWTQGVRGLCVAAWKVDALS